MYMVSVSLSSVCIASWLFMMLFFVAWMRMPNVPRIVMFRVLAKILAGSSSRRAVRLFWYAYCITDASAFLRPAVFAAF